MHGGAATRSIMRTSFALLCLLPISKRVWMPGNCEELTTLLVSRPQAPHNPGFQTRHVAGFPRVCALSIRTSAKMTVWKPGLREISNAGIYLE